VVVYTKGWRERQHCVKGEGLAGWVRAAMCGVVLGFFQGRGGEDMSRPISVSSNVFPLAR